MIQINGLLHLFEVRLELKRCEATNSLDAKTDAGIVESIDSLFYNKTKLIIAHRLNTVRNADKIIVLKNGKIVEEGKHPDLIQHNSYYYDLIKQQLEFT